MKTISAILVALFLTACGAEGDACNPASGEDLCGSWLDYESVTCAACPASAGYGSLQGVCTTSSSVSASECAEVWPAPSGGGGGATDCNNVWTCAYDGQATPLCMAACSYSGTQRMQTCQVLASYMTSGNAGECCTSCR